jgi:hypothetical protein
MLVLHQSGVGLTTVILSGRVFPHIEQGVTFAIMKIINTGDPL